MRSPGAIGAATGLLCAMALAAANARGQAPPEASPPPARGFSIQWRQPLTHRGAVSLAAGDESVVATGPGGGVASFARADGRPLWSAAVASALPPVPVRSLVGVASSTELIAFHQADGRVAWRATLDSPPTTLIAAGDRFLVASPAGLRAWQPDGADDWRAALDAAPVGPTAVSGDLLLVAIAQPALVAFEAATGRQRWRIPLPASPRGLSVGSDRVYLDAGDSLLAYRLTGDPTPAWRHRVVNAIGAAAADETRVYFSLIDNTVRGLDRSGGSMRWSRVLPSRPASGPMLVGAALMVALSTGEIIELSPADGKVLSAPAPADLAGHRIQGAAASASPPQLFSVSTGTDTVPVLFGWGRPATEAPRSGGPPAAVPRPR